MRNFGLSRQRSLRITWAVIGFPCLGPYLPLKARLEESPGVAQGGSWERQVVPSVWARLLWLPAVIHPNGLWVALQLCRKINARFIVTDISQLCKVRLIVNSETHRLIVLIFLKVKSMFIISSPLLLTRKTRISTERKWQQEALTPQPSKRHSYQLRRSPLHDFRCSCTIDF